MSDGYEVGSTYYASKAEYKWQQEQIQELHQHETMLRKLLMNGVTEYEGLPIQDLLDEMINEEYPKYGIYPEDPWDDWIEF